jgi:TPR repeat protein
MVYEDDWQWHRDARKLCDQLDWQAAEDIYVSVAEQPQSVRHSSAAINSLVFSILIPQGRFVEARVWSQNSIDMEVPWECWNSLENLGVCEYHAGNNELAELYLQQVVDADDGPVDAAKKLLKKIQEGKFAKPGLVLNLKYGEEWRDLDVSGPVAPKSSQREFYLRMIKVMYVKKQKFDPNYFEQLTGASITAFTNGVFTGRMLNLSASRDAAAKAALDYFYYVQLGQDPNEDTYNVGLELWNANKKKEALSKLRLASRQGNVDAMYLVAQGVEELYGEDLAMPWYRLASANGHEDAQEHLDDYGSNSWDDDELPTNTGAGFCTNCGTARSGTAKFCTNCGTAFEQPKILATKKTDKPKSF